MNIFYLTNHSVYKVGANSNRILCISKGLISLGHNTTIIHTAAIDIPKKVIDECIYGKIFNPTCKKKKYTLIGRTSFAILSFLACIKCYIYIKRELKTSKAYIIVVDTLFLNKFIYFLLHQHKNAVLVKEVLEFPLHDRVKLSLINNLYYKLNYFLEYTIFDFYMPISTAIDNYIHSKTKKKIIQSEIIPICVQMDRFSDKTSCHNNFKPYIAYCGDMSNNKDGVEILLDSFEQVFSRHPEFSLVLIGTGIGNYYNELLKKQEILHSNKNIHFVGSKSREEMPGYLTNANILALTRPQNKQTEGGLPTKLGEYLATGNPVIVSDVSDISYYLKPYNAAFIIKPGSVEDATEKLLLAIESPELSAEKGKNGRIASEELFSETKVAEKIVSFLKKISTDAN
jgi:glycosyltransferase involved in cell wall biosynthesis